MSLKDILENEHILSQMAIELCRVRGLDPFAEIERTIIVNQYGFDEEHTTICERWQTMVNEVKSHIQNTLVLSEILEPKH
jgi:hypothetical protein